MSASALQKTAPHGKRTDAPAASQPVSREALIDEYGELDRQYRLWQPHEKRYEALKAEIKGWYENTPAEMPQVAEGTLYRLSLTAQQNESTPNLPLLWKKFGKAGFFKLVVIWKTAVAKALAGIGEKSDEEAVEAYFTKGRTGSRRLTAVLKTPAA